MEGYAVILIAFGSVVAGLTILGCLCNSRSDDKKKTVAGDVETGTGTTAAGTGRKDGGMMFLGGAGAGVATAAVVAGIAGGDGGDSGGGCDSGGGGGGCGGGGGGGCGS